MRIKQFKNLALMVLVSTTIVGCNVMQSDLEEPSSLKITMKAETGSSSLSKTGTSTIQADSIEITEVKMFLDEMELESVYEDSLDFELNNVVVNLPLDGSPLQLTELEVPEGKYDELEFKIKRRPYHTGVQTNDPDFDDGNRKYALVIRGFVDGQPFMFRSDKVFKLELDLDPELDVFPGAETELTIAIDVNKWFVDRRGNLLDPNNRSDEKWIEQNIRKSFIILKRQFYSERDDDDDECENEDCDGSGRDDDDDDDGEDDGEDDGSDDGEDDGEDEGEDDSNDNGNGNGNGNGNDDDSDDDDDDDDSDDDDEEDDDDDDEDDDDSDDEDDD